MIAKTSSTEEKEVADLPDFIRFERKQDKPSIEQMLEQQKRKDELNRVNQKFGSRQDQKSSPSKVERQKSYDVDEMLKMKTSDFMDEAERQLL